MNNIYLRIPSKDEILIRKKWMEDKDTMSYNAGYYSNMNGYNYNDGTIFLDNNYYLDFYDNWINQEPLKYFTFIFETSTDTPIGEVYFYFNQVEQIHNMGILIDSKYRNKGYSREALLEFLNIAFNRIGIKRISNTIPTDRQNAIKLFKGVGFYQNRIINGVKFDKPEESLQLVITKESFERRNK